MYRRSCPRADPDVRVALVLVPTAGLGLLWLVYVKFGRNYAVGERRPRWYRDGQAWAQTDVMDDDEIDEFLTSAKAAAWHYAHLADSLAANAQQALDAVDPHECAYFSARCAALLDRDARRRSRRSD
jgi:hypothetical protein